MGHGRFLINLKSKATGRLAESIVKDALGARCEAIPFETKRRGEKFIPGRSLRKRAAARKGNATIEREAAQVFGSYHGVALLLADGGKTETYQYDGAVGLMLGAKDDQKTDLAANVSRDAVRGAVSSIPPLSTQEILHIQVSA